MMMSATSHQQMQLQAELAEEFAAKKKIQYCAGSVIQKDSLVQV